MHARRWSRASRTSSRAGPPTSSSGWPRASSACGARAGRTAPNGHLPHLLGLPTGWPHIVFEDRPIDAAHWKLRAIDGHAGPHRPAAWIDDDHDERCRAWAAARPGPTLLVTTDPAVGLTEAQADQLEAWAASA